jgi:hypothetical protein
MSVLEWHQEGAAYGEIGAVGRREQMILASPCFVPTIPHGELSAGNLGNLRTISN